MTDVRGSLPTVAPETIEALRALDAATIYNVLKGLGRAEPGSYSGPDLRCLFPDLGTLVVSLPYNPRSTDVDRFRRLRSGDNVRLSGRLLNAQRFELEQFL